MQEELTVIEQTELEQCEEVIDRGLKTFVEVGNALVVIRDSRLYRAEFGTFEEYCRERWQMQRNYANKLIAAAQVVGNLGTVVPILPNTESQVRPLACLDPEEQPIVWQRAVETSSNGKPTAAHVEATVKEYKQAQQPEDNTYEQQADALAGDESAYDWTEEPEVELCAEVMPPWYEDEPSEPIIEAPVTIQPNGLSIHFSSDSPEHYTPDHIIDLVLEVMAGIDLDPCSNSKTNPSVPAAVHYTLCDDGLSKDWTGSVYMNPPYGREIGGWVEKLRAEFEAGHVPEAIALVPARVDTAWWEKLTSVERTYPLVCFIKGRLTFIGNEDPAPFPSALVYLGDNRVEFYNVFSAIGRIWGAWNDEIAGITDYGSNQ